MSSVIESDSNNAQENDDGSQPNAPPKMQFITQHVEDISVQQLSNPTLESNTTLVHSKTIPIDGACYIDKDFSKN